MKNAAKCPSQTTISFDLHLSVAVWTWARRLQRGHRSRSLGMPDAKDRFVIGKYLLHTWTRDANDPYPFALSS